VETNISVDNLGKHFGHIKAVDGVSFTVEKGEVLGFLGPNGAGKSTTMKMLTCFLPPSFGSARVCGFDIINDSMEVRRHIGYLPESAAAYGEMNATDFLNFIAEIRGFSGRERNEKVNRIVEVTQLGSVLNQEIDTLSKGYKRRVVLAQALIHDPPVLIMDEPTDGLDPNQKQEVRTLIKKLAHDKVIVLSTHILEEVDAVCTRAIIIDSGKIVADGTPDELRQKSDYAGAVDISVLSSTAPDAYDTLKKLPHVMRIEIINDGSEINRYLVVPEKGTKIAHEISKLSHDKNWEIEGFSVERGRLDQVFRSITTGGQA
jgi:ABC-2 type transport system ATP-binding protein